MKEQFKKDFYVLNNKELCGKYSVSERTIYNWAKELGLKRETHKFDTLDKEEFVRKYKNLPYETLKERYGVSKTTLWLWAKRLGVEKNSEMVNKGQESIWTDDMKKHLINFNGDWKYLTEVTGKSKDACRAKMKMMGMKK